MTATTGGPTRGAFEQPDDARWQASPIRAAIIRALVVVSPIVAAFVGLYMLAPIFYRPPGALGMVLWFTQGLVTGTAISMTIERLGRGLLPLATLFSMSLIFPDRAPSRFSVALRAGTVRKLKEQGPAAQADLLGDDASEAAERAIEYVAALGRHDRLTRGHTERVRAYADIIAGQMGLSPADRAKLTWGVMLHDIGKMTVPPEVLNKQGKLTDEEWNVLRGHPEAGLRMLSPLREWLGPWALAAGEHHERWDGGGYPRGLAGSDISLAGRITAVADAYDVITSKRSYKEPMSPAAARRELVVCSGTQFDPDVVRAFLNVSLGRRWSAGVLAAVSHLPISNLGTAPAAVTIGAVVTAGSVAVGMAPVAAPVELAFDDAVTIVEPIETTTTVTTVVAATAAPTGGTAPLGELVIDRPTTTAPPTTTTTIESSTTTTAAPTTIAPTTSAPTTAPLASTTTAPPATTTTAPPTTAAPTTTTAPTTSTTAPSGAVFYLKNPGPDGDTTAQILKPLELSTPTALAQHNFDTDRDTTPGLSLAPTVDGWSENDTPQIQRFFLDPPGPNLSGPITLRLYAATDTNGATATLRVSVADCNWLGSPASCTSLGPDVLATTSTWVDVGFEELVIGLGSPTHSFGWGRRLVVRVITEGSETVHTAFDSSLHPSRVTLTLS